MFHNVTGGWLFCGWSGIALNPILSLFFILFFLLLWRSILHIEWHSGSVPDQNRSTLRVRKKYFYTEAVGVMLSRVDVSWIHLDKCMIWLNFPASLTFSVFARLLFPLLLLHLNNSTWITVFCFSLPTWKLISINKTLKRSHFDCAVKYVLSCWHLESVPKKGRLKKKERINWNKNKQWDWDWNGHDIVLALVHIHIDYGTIPNK